MKIVVRVPEGIEPKDKHVVPKCCVCNYRRMQVRHNGKPYCLGHSPIKGRQFYWRKWKRATTRHMRFIKMVEEFIDANPTAKGRGAIERRIESMRVLIYAEAKGVEMPPRT